MSARDDYPKLHAETSGPHHQGQTSDEAQKALDEIDHLRARERILEAAVADLLTGTHGVTDIGEVMAE